MLMTSQHYSRHQLFSDLCEVRSKIDKSWVKNGFQGPGDAVCLVAAAELITEQEVGFIRLSSDNLTPAQMRLGRVIFALYTGIYGDKAHTNVTLSHAMGRVADFNDHDIVDKETILLMLDKAIAEVTVCEAVTA